jgi:S-DNA-T family DNA segregation ATPase FtsK/SpoIIIE
MDLTRKIAGAVLGFLMLFLFLSLVTFDPHDPPDPEYPANVHPHNAAGLVGAYVAYWLHKFLGWTSFLVIGLLGFWAAVLMTRYRIHRKWLNLAGILILLPVTSAFFSIPFASPGGGIVGVSISSILIRFLNRPGTYLLLSCFLVLALGLASDLLIFKGIKMTALYLWPRLVSKRKRVYVKKVVEPARARVQSPASPEVKPPPSKPSVAKEEPVKLETEPSVGADYILPSAELLEEPEELDLASQEEMVQEKGRILVKCLSEFGVEGRLAVIRTGPVVTQYELELAPGVKVGKVASLSDDIAMALAAPSVRVVAPIPGKTTVGVEVPNIEKDTVRLKKLLASEELKTSDYEIPVLLGRDASGNPLAADLTAMPHLLIAGATGSGKSVCINAIILSVLFLQHPERVKLLLVDPKQVEFTAFKEIPHLITPLVTDMRKAAGVLEWAMNEMDKRYDILATFGVRDIKGYNRIKRSERKRRLAQLDEEERAEVPEKLPYVIVIVDELADLMMMARNEVEGSIIRLAQKSRSVGLHIVLATQRPSADVITGLIKSNLPARICFKVAAKVDSRIILDTGGGETLLGRGDMLFLKPGTSKLIRAQGTFVSDDEIRRVVSFITTQAKPEYSAELVRWKPEKELGLRPSERDPLYDEAVRIVIETQRGSVSLLQRRLEIGYSRAARLVDMMAEEGIVGEYKGSQAREVLWTLEEWQARETRTSKQDRRAP